MPTALPDTNADDDWFVQLQADHHGELLVHCYRMLGALPDAEDALQEAWLRAWQGRGQSRGVSRRAWLYAIATNACLDALRRRRRRVLPPAVRPASDGTEAPILMTEGPWLGPFPDALLPKSGLDPEARYELKESVSLAFLAAIQLLPVRQRAVLLLRDVVGWSARDVAKKLSTSVTAVNSSLQRARARLRSDAGAIGSRSGASSRLGAVATASERALLDRFLAAWEAGDLDGLECLLTEDVTVTMPPDALWFNDRLAFLGFLRSNLFRDDLSGRFRLLPISGNGLPGFAVYAGGGGSFAALSLLFIEVDGDRIGALRGFVQPELFPRFGVPSRLTPHEGAGDDFRGLPTSHEGDRHPPRVGEPK